MDKYIAKFEVQQFSQQERKTQQQQQDDEQIENKNDYSSNESTAVSVNRILDPQAASKLLDNTINSVGINQNEQISNENQIIMNDQLNNSNNVPKESNSNLLQNDYFDENDDNENSDAASYMSSRCESQNLNDKISDNNNNNNNNFSQKFIKESFSNISEINDQKKSNLINDQQSQIFLELNCVYLEARFEIIDEVELQQQINFRNEKEESFNSEVMIKFLREYYNDEYRCMTQDASQFMNNNNDKIIKILQKDQYEQDQEQFRVQLFKILQSIEGKNHEMLEYIKVISITKYYYQNIIEMKKQFFYVVEINIGQNTLYNFLKFLKDKNINDTLMNLIFSGLVDALLQMHSRYQVVNSLGLHSIYIHQKNLYILDYFGESIQFDSNQPYKDLQYIIEDDAYISKKDQIDYFKKDIFQLGKCLIALLLIQQGYMFSAIEDLLKNETSINNNNDIQPDSVQDQQSGLVLFAKKHNCNEYFLKAKKFIAIEDSQIVMYEIQNILEEMLQEKPKQRISSVKLAMICQKSNLLLRDVVYQYFNEFPPQFQLDQDKNLKTLIYPFKPIKQTQDTENHAQIMKNDEVIFDGFIDILKVPVEHCSINIFQQFIFEGYFIAGSPYLQGTLKYKNNNNDNNIIIQGDCYNFILKQWLIKSRILEEAIITNLFQISKWQRGKQMNVELSNIIIAGGNRKITKLNNNYVMDDQIFECVHQIIEQIELVNLNNLDIKIIKSHLTIEKLKDIRYLVISLDTEEKAEFLNEFLNSQYCSNLEVLDLSFSTKLDYKDYLLNKTMNIMTGSFSKLNTIVINNCKSSAPYQFFSILLNYENFKRISILHMDETLVDQSLFVRMFESPFISSIKYLSLEDTAGINDQSVIQFSERMSKFKNLISLNLSGLLKKNFNKSLFSDSNISAFKKLASQMHYLIFLEKLVLDDSYINDSVLEQLSKCNMPSLIKIYLRKQQKATYKGLQYLLTTQNFRNLQLINCNASQSITLPKNITSHIEISVMNCKSISSSNIADYIRTNPNVINIRIDARCIASEVIQSINMAKYIKKITVYCSEFGDIQKILSLLRSLDKSKKLQLCINFHLSKSFIAECDYNYLGQNCYKRNIPNNGTTEQIISDFNVELKKQIDSKQIQPKIIENLIIHRSSYFSFYSNQSNSIQQTDISHFISLPLTTKSQKDHFKLVAANLNSLDNNIIDSKKNSQNQQSTIIHQINPNPNNNNTIKLPEQSQKNQSLSSSFNNDIQENHFNEELKKQFQNSNQQFSRMQYLEDLNNFLNNPKLLSNYNSLNLTPFSIGPDEMNQIVYSIFLNKMDSLILQNSYLRSQDLRLMSMKSHSLQNLTMIDLSNNKLSIINGIISLTKSTSLPNLNSIKLGQYKIKILLKNLTYYFRRVSIPLTLISHFPKFNTENKIKIMVQNNPSNKKYLETLDFYVKKGDYINEGMQCGHLKVLMNSFITFYINNCQKYPEQTHNLHRIMRFQRMKELQQQPFGPQGMIQKKEEQNKMKEKANLTISVIGHELSGKSSIVENFLQNNYREGQELMDMKQYQNKNGLANSQQQINLGLRYYHTEFIEEENKQKINMAIKVMHSNPMFNQLRLNHLSNCDGIFIIYDNSRKDIAPEMMQYLYEVHLFKYQKPVYMLANNFKSKQNANILDKNNLIPDIKYTDISLNNISSIKTVFSSITRDALLTKGKKTVFTNSLLLELSEELNHLHLHEFNLKFDFLKVRNKVDFDTLKQFCLTQKENTNISKMNLDILNWGNYGKSAEDILNKIGEQDIKIRIKNSISMYINN